MTKSSEHPSLCTFHNLTEPTLQNDFNKYGNHESGLVSLLIRVIIRQAILMLTV